MDKYREAFGTDVPMFAISAVTREGTEALVKAIAEDIHEQPDSSSKKANRMSALMKTKKSSRPKAESLKR